MKTILFVSGYSGSGKDTYADALSPTFQKMAFASSIKDLVSREYGIVRASLDTQEGKRISYQIEKYGVCTARDLLIREGNLGRQRDPDIWAKLLYEKIENKNLQRVVISDFRYPNEFDFFKKKGEFRCVHLRIRRTATSPVEDPSEYQLSNFPMDYTFENVWGLKTMTLHAQQLKMGLILTEN